MERSMTISDWTQEWADSKFLANRYLPETNSTNTFAKDNLPEDEFELIMTDHQTAGRGRGVNKWVDTEPGTTLLSSWIFQSIKAPQPIATPLIGLALYHSAMKVWPSLRFSMKAPNDLYCVDKKVAGLLVETVSEGVSHFLIVGLGVNVMTHPGVDNSGAIKDFLAPTEITRESWMRFLDFFKSGLDAAFFELSNSTLSERKRLLILEALNNFPMLPQRYVEVMPDGSLRTASSTIPWSRL
jgi:BirA family transcriptional regulator, biotin operon repressor / biotin---[acetyl-CoA-carboxylase] ligase